MYKIQNKNRTTYCGAWLNFGFHEDGLTSGLLAALSLGAAAPFDVYLNGGFPTLRTSLEPPEYLKDKVKKYRCPTYDKSTASRNGDWNDLLLFKYAVMFLVVFYFMQLLL
jgi:hypothetical protein